MTATIAETETHQNGTAHTSLGSAFDAACVRHADRIAVSLDGEQRTYRQLHGEAERVKAAVAQASRSIVAIYLDRSIAMVAAMLGVIQAGATYLPLDTTYPAGRLDQTLADAQPALILTTRILAANLLGSKIPFVFIEELDHTTAAPRSTHFIPADQIAYIIYTSGSTGRPKGVRVTHRNVLRLFTQTEKWFHFTEQDVWTMFHSFAFDFSVWEMWGPLLSGGRLVIVPFAVSRSPEDFYSLLLTEQVTVLNQTPSAFLLLSQQDASRTQPLALRLVILGGEALNLQSLRPWFKRHGDARPQIVNMYGITETTVHVTYRRVMAQDSEQEKESLIGEPIGDLQFYLLDDALRPVRDGDTGEICIGGAGVAAGYLNRPALTAERFVRDPFIDAETRLYRSGDLGRRRQDGELVYLGRADRQVKINGFRIELGEIEAALMECTGVAQASVAARADASAGTRLAAYYVGSAAPQQLSRQLTERLPAHLRPAFYTKLDAMPLNGNGKIDQAAFPSPTETPFAAALMPATNTEAIVSAVWQSVLERGGIGRDENFFDIGGSSLLLIAVRANLQRRLERAIPVLWLFEFPSIRTLSAKLIAEEQPVLTGPVSTSQDLAHTRADRQRESFSRARAQRSGSR